MYPVEGWLIPVPLPWPVTPPCASFAEVVVTAAAGQRFGWDDPTRYDNCGREAPERCGADLRGALDGDGLLTCGDSDCTWTFPPSDFTGGRIVAFGVPGEPPIRVAMQCPSAEGGAVFWDVQPTSARPTVNLAETFPRRVLTATSLQRMRKAPAPRDAAALLDLSTAALTEIQTWLASCEDLPCGETLQRLRGDVDTAIAFEGSSTKYKAVQPYGPEWSAEVETAVRDLVLDLRCVLALDTRVCGVLLESRTANERARFVEGPDGGGLFRSVTPLFTFARDGTITLEDVARVPERRFTNPSQLPVVTGGGGWHTLRGDALTRAIALSAEVEDDLPADLVPCTRQAWRRSTPDLTGDGRSDQLVRVRQTFAHEASMCDRDPEGRAPEYTFLVSDPNLPPIAIDARGGMDPGRELDIVDYVRLPDGQTGLRGNVTWRAGGDLACDVYGQWAGMIEGNTMTLLADTSPGQCPSGGSPRR